MPINQLNIRSEELDEILGKKPNKIIRWGISVILFVLIILLTGSWFFKYPYFIDTKFLILSNNPPIVIYSPRNGFLDSIYVRNKQLVDKNQILATYSSSTNLKDILFVERIINEIEENNFKTNFDKTKLSKNLYLGGLQYSFYSFINKYQESEELNQKTNKDNQKNRQELKKDLQNLINGIKEWKNENLISSPIKGTCYFSLNWNDNFEVYKNEIFAKIIPEGKKTCYGRLVVPIKSINNVQKGQKVIIKLHNYPYLQYGSIISKIDSISTTAFDDNFYAYVSFTSNQKTTNGVKIKLISNMEGYASIVTEEASLLHRIINPIVSILSRKQLKP